jgi:hypothetical protein
LLGTAVVAVTPGFTVNEKDAVAVELLTSATVTVYVVTGLVALGMPAIVPVEELMLRPVGRAGEML